LNWTDRSDNEDGFKIEKKIGQSGTYNELETVAADITTFTDPNQEVETKYYYRVQAFKAQLSSTFFNETSVTTHSPPTMLTATSGPSLNINLSWSDNSQLETGYEIWRKSAQDANFSLVTTVAANENSYTDSNLAALTTYEYKIRAVSTNSGSDFSNQASATTPSDSGGSGGVCFITVSSD
jgi:titin